MDALLAGQPGEFAFVFHYHKALILAKAGDKAGAIAAAQKSLELVSKQSGEIKDEYTQKNNAVIASLH